MEEEGCLRGRERARGREGEGEREGERGREREGGGRLTTMVNVVIQVSGAADDNKEVCTVNECGRAWFTGYGPKGPVFRRDR
ncbi:MAG: hypothetical protein ACYDGY_07665 [Acidimicrobiales bacterium]